MAAGFLVCAVGEALGIHVRAGAVDRNLAGRNACELTLFFHHKLIVNVVFAGFQVKIHKFLCIAKFLEFQVDVFVHFKFFLA